MEEMIMQALVLANRPPPPPRFDLWICYDWLFWLGVVVALIGALLLSTRRPADHA